MISDVEDYFLKGCGRCARFDTERCSTRLWAQGLSKLREICLSADLTETVKWGHPCYMHTDRNIAIIGAFQNDFRLNFLDAVLLKDSALILEKQGPNTRHPGVIRFTSNKGPHELEDIILIYLAEAKSHAEAGKRPPKDDRELELPDELVEALDADPEMAEAFHALTRGRQKSYVINLSSAKKSETRANRIKTYRDRIIEGKGATER